MARRRQGGKVSVETVVERPAGPVGLALEAASRGDFRQARKLARSALAGAPSADAAARARQVLDDTRPDPAALLTALAVLAIIAVAAWVALQHH